MKKISIVVLMMAMIAMMATPSFAQLRKDLSYTKGKVVYVNAARNEITIKDFATGKDITFAASKGVDVGVGPGNDVTIIFKKGTTTATSVRLIGGRKAAASPAPAAPAAQPVTQTPAKKSSWY